MAFVKTTNYVFVDMFIDFRQTDCLVTRMRSLGFNVVEAACGKDMCSDRIYITTTMDEWLAFEAREFMGKYDARYYTWPSIADEKYKAA